MTAIPALLDAQSKLKASVENLELGFKNGITRTQLGDIRMTVTAALCKINDAERILVGVPRPKSGD